MRMSGGRGRSGSERDAPSSRKDVCDDAFLIFDPEICKTARRANEDLFVQDANGRVVREPGEETGLPV